MNSQTEYTASDYVEAFRRRNGVLLLVAIPIVLMAAATSFFLPDEYTSAARIDINLEGSSARTLEPIEVSTYADQYIADLENRVLTYANFRTLANDPELFESDQEPVSEDDRIRMVSESAWVSLTTQQVSSPTSGREVDLISGVRVGATSADPKFVFRVADNLANLFFEADRLSRTEEATSTLTFLNEQMELTEKEILALEQEVAEFKVANACCLPEIVDINMANIQRAERDIEALQPRIRTLEQERSFVRAQLDEIDRFGEVANRLNQLEQEYTTLVANYGLDHPDVIRLRREIVALTSADATGADTVAIVELRMKLAEAEQRYSSEHPDVLRYKRDLAALESKGGSTGSGGPNPSMDNPRYIQLRSELNAINTQLDELRRSQPLLRQKIEDYENRLARTPQVESAFQAIERRLRSSQESNDDLQRRAANARQSEALESTDIGARLTQISAARLPELPSGPPRTAIMILGLFLAGTLGLGAMLFVEMTDSTVRNSKDIAAEIDMVPLATIPVIQNSLTVREQKRRLILTRGATFIVIIVVILSFFRNQLYVGVS